MASNIWTDEEEERFQKCLVKYEDTNADCRWIWIARDLGRSEDDVEGHFQELVNAPLGSSSSSVLENKWTDEEEQMFQKLLDRFGAERDDRWIWIARSFPGRSEADVEHHFEETRAGRGSSSSSVIVTNFSGLLPVRFDADVVQHSEASSSSRPRGTTSSATNANSPSSSSAVDNSCPICLATPKDTAFGCGHTACSECATMLSACPICRKPIESRLKIYH